MNNVKRYLALDVMRGLTIVMMIIVNNPGSWAHIYTPLEHSKWHGCTPTDLVFPFFLFVVGVSMFFSFSKYGSTLNKDSLIRVVKRTLLIFAIGLFLNSFPQWKKDFSYLRIMGVLQRIALVYGIGSILVLSFKQKMLPFISVAILLLYWGILYWFGTGNVYSLEGNATIPFDKWIFGENHMYKGFGIRFDPEGLLSTFPAIASVLIGYLIGVLIKESEKKAVPAKIIGLGIVGLIFGLMWNIVFPINKALWTSSYVLYTSGWACIVLGILIYIIDVLEYKRWTNFFVVFGKNPLFIFFLSGLWTLTIIYLIRIPVSGEKTVSGYSWLYHNVFQPLAGDINGSLLFALAHVVLFWLIGFVLYRKKIFIKV